MDEDIQQLEGVLSPWSGSLKSEGPPMAHRSSVFSVPSGRPPDTHGRYVSKPCCLCGCPGPRSDFL